MLPFAALALSLTSGASLSGVWSYHVGDLPAAPAAAASLDEDEWPRMAVPSNWYEQGLDHAGVVWFARPVVVARGGRYALELGGVNYQADVYWDGARVGGHTGYFAPFSVPVTAQAGVHLLAIRVDSPDETPEHFSLRKTLIKGVLSHHDTRPGGAWSAARGQDANTGGIWGDVRLMPDRPAVRPRVTTLACDERRARLRLEADAPARLRLVDPDGRTVWSGRVAGSRVITVEHPRCWWPIDLGEPALYTVEGGGAPVRTGLRTVRLDGSGRLLINETPVFLRGTNYIGGLYLASLGDGPVRRDLLLMRGANINAVRVHAHVTAPAFYDVADELGLLVFQDFPLQWGYDDGEAFRAEAVRQAGEMIALLGRHPSVVHWTGHNEAPWSADWMVYKYPDYAPDQNRALDRALADTFLRLDPSRPSQGNSHTAEHAWQGWYSGSLRDFQRPQSLPILTEYGAQAVPRLETLRTFLSVGQLWPLTGANLEAWSYHNFQLRELTEIARVKLGASVDELIANSQAYQARLLQVAAESLRLQKYQPVTAIFQFMFVEHWPSMSWGVVDYLRVPKPGYAALARAYQPLLPIAVRRPGAARLELHVVNDRHEALPGLRLEARRSVRGAVEPTVVILPVDVPADDRVSAGTLDLGPGALELRLLAPDGRVLAANAYEPDYFNRDERGSAK